MEQEKKTFKTMSPEEKRAYNREAEKVKDTDESKQKKIAFVNKYNFHQTHQSIAREADIERD